MGKCLRRQSRLENVGSHTKAQFLYLSGAAAGQSCAGLGTGGRWQMRQEQVVPCQLCPVMPGSQGIPPGGAHFPSCLALTGALLVENSELLLSPAFSPLVSFVVLLLAQGSL